MGKTAAYISEFGAFDLSSLAQQGGALFVSRVAFESALLPRIAVDDPFGTDGNATTETSGGFDLTDAFLKVLKPKVTVQTASGPVSVAPFGEPSGNYWPFVAAGLLLVGSLAVYGSYKLLRGGR